MRSFRIAACCCAWVVALASCRDDKVVTLGPPVIVLEPSSLAFDPVEPGSRTLRSVKVTNAGQLPLEVSGLLMEQTVPVFSVSAEAPLKLGQNEHLFLDVTFAPTAAGQFAGRLVFESNDPLTSVATIELGGTATPRGLAADSGTPDPDAGVAADSGTPDAGTDAGARDAGPPPDAGDSCLDRPEGTIRWAYPAAGAPGGYLFSSPALGDDGTIYFGDSKGALVALWPNGTVKWTWQSPGQMLAAGAPAIGASGTVYFGTYDASLYAVSAAGVLEWSFPTNGPVNSSPAIGADGTVYFGSADGHLYAVAANGSQRWAFDAGAYVYSSPAVGPDGAIYFGTKYPGKLFAVNPDGTQRWQFPIGSDVDSSPALGTDGTVYVGADDGVLYAVRPNGTLQWQQTVGGGGQGGSDSSPALAKNGTVSVGSWSSRVDAVSPAGALKWTFSTGTAVGWSSPTVGADGVQYLGTKDAHAVGLPSRLLALDPGGTLKWDLQLPGFIDTSPALADDGTLYFGSWNGKLYAVCSHSAGLADSTWPKFRRDRRNTGRLPGCTIDIQVQCTTGGASYKISVNDADPGRVTFTDPTQGTLDNFCVRQVGPLTTPAKSGTLFVSYGLGSCQATAHQSGNTCSASKSYSCP